MQVELRADLDAFELHLTELTTFGNAGGFRPKALFFFGDDFSRASLVPKEESTAWLVKFTASDFPLGHEDDLFKAAALAASEKAGIRTPAWRLFEGPQGRGRPKVPSWLGMERFDRTPAGRVHYVSAERLEEIVRQAADVALRFPEIALYHGAKRAAVKEVKAQVEAAVAENLKVMEQS